MQTAALGVAWHACRTALWPDVPHGQGVDRAPAELQLRPADAGLFGRLQHNNACFWTTSPCNHAARLRVFSVVVTA
eukprot:349894-Chlamydomonas_euryale.AAC.14